MIDIKNKKRKGIKGIAYGLASTFSSRNNDIKGSWAIGQLYKFAKNNNVLKLEIDLLNTNISIPNKSFEEMAQKYKEQMFNYLNGYNLAKENILLAKITLSFDPTKTRKIRSSWYQNKTYDKFYCEVIIVDDLEIKRKGDFNGWCYPDNILRV